MKNKKYQTCRNELYLPFMVDIVRILKNEDQNGKSERGIIFHNSFIHINVLISVLNQKQITLWVFFLQYNTDKYNIANIVYKTVP